MNDKPTKKNNIIGKILRPWWRLTRAQTLGGQCAVFDKNNSILLIRHGYRPGWHFPGGGVEHGETALMAAGRETREETGIEIDFEKARLHGFFANFHAFPGDHIALYVVNHWQRLETPAPNAEIREQQFFSPDKLPQNTGEATKRRLSEILHGTPNSQYW